MISIIIMTIFSVFGINYLKEAMYNCEEMTEKFLESVKTKAECFDYGGGNW